MNFSELKDEIELVVDPEDSTLIDLIPSLINEAILYIATESGLLLPSLKTITTLDTVEDQAYNTLPAGYNGKLIFASVGGVKIAVSLVLEDLLEQYPDLTKTGDIELIALEDNILWYAKIPDEVTSIFLMLYANPAELVKSTDIPVEIPEQFHRHTIKPYVAKYLFDLIEQDYEGNKPNMQVQQLFYDKGITQLRSYLAARRRGMSRSIWNV